MGNLTRKNIIAAAISLIACVLIYIFVIQPTVKDIKTYNNRIRSERVSLEDKYTSRRNVKNITADLKRIAEKLDPLFKKMVIQSDREAEFISGLEKIAKKNNLTQKIQISSVRQMDGEKLAQKRDIAVVLSGNYIDTLKYLESLESSDLYIILDGVNISSAKIQAAKTVISSGTTKTTLRGYAYFST